MPEPEKKEFEGTSQSRSSREEGDKTVRKSLQNIWVAPEPNLMGLDELRSLLGQYPPQATRDIAAIEKGAEHYFLFNDSPLALTTPDRLEYLSPENLRTMEDRRVFTSFDFIVLNDAGGLGARRALIRPESLRGDQVARIKNGCIRESVLNIIRYIDKREKDLIEMEKKGEAGEWISSLLMRKNPRAESHPEPTTRFFVNFMENLYDLSFESVLEEDLHPDPWFSASLITLLSFAPDRLVEELSGQGEVADDVREILRRRGTKAILFDLAPGIFFVEPPSDIVLSLETDQIREIHTELEWIHAGCVQVARRALLTLLPQEESGWIQRKGIAQDEELLNELRKHASFTETDRWPNAPIFLQVFERLIQESRHFRKVRRELHTRLLMQSIVSRIDSSLEPLLLSQEGFYQFAGLQSPGKGPIRDDLYRSVTAMIGENPEILKHDAIRQEDGRKGSYLLATKNLADAFIKYRNLRSLLHNMARENGIEEGIYSQLREVRPDRNDSAEVKRQLQLTKAIREWESDLEKEQGKRKKSDRSFIDLLADAIVNILRAILGMGKKEAGSAQEAGIEDASMDGESTGERGGRKRSRKKHIASAKEKTEMIIPDRVEHAIEQVETHNNGIIWLDELAQRLQSVRLNQDSLGDLLFYDKQKRFTEIRPLLGVRRAYIRTALEADRRWLTGFVEQLESMRDMPEEMVILLDYFKEKLPRK